MVRMGLRRSLKQYNIYPPSALVAGSESYYWKQ